MELLIFAVFGQPLRHGVERNAGVFLVLKLLLYVDTFVNCSWVDTLRQ